MQRIQRTMFPYGMERNADGTWTLFNRNYKPVGVVTPEWAEWDDPRHKVKLSGVSEATLRKLSVHSPMDGNRIYFYEDESDPDRSKANMDAYLEKLRLLMKFKSA